MIPTVKHKTMKKPILPGQLRSEPRRRNCSYRQGPLRITYYVLRIGAPPVETERRRTGLMLNYCFPPVHVSPLPAPPFSASLLLNFRSCGFSLSFADEPADFR